MYSNNLTTSNLHYEKFSDGSVKQIDVPYEIPESWGWVKLNNIIKLTSGRDLPKEKYSDKEIKTYPYITGASNFSNLKIITNRYTDDNSVLSYRGDILIPVKGTIGELAFNPFKAAYIARQVMAISGVQIYSDYLFFYLQNSISILKNKGQSLIPGISRETILNLFIPIPPLKEQKRIVEILFKAIPKFEKYSCCYYELKKLNSDFLEKLRKSILQYAMQGKLVPQYATDESVEVLLERIKEEKQRLFEEGKLKKKDLQESIIYQGDDNSYYEKNNKEVLQLENITSIPKTWKYLRFHQIVNYYMGKTPPRSVSTYWGKDIPWVSIADMVSNGIIQSTKEALSNRFKASIQEKISPPNTLLMSFKLTVGKVSLLGIEAAHNEAIISIFPYADTNEIIKMYLFKFLPEIVKYGDSKEAIKGTTLNSKSIDALLIPLPPMEEQKRIVSKIEKLDLSIAKLIYIKDKN